MAAQQMMAIGRKVSRPRPDALASAAPWGPPSIADLVDRIDAALRQRRAG